MDNYHIYESIGKGMHSTVYKGRRRKGLEYYAIKSVDKTEKQRVHQEVKIIHDLKHHNILRFYSWYETKNHLWLILEYCVGGDLDRLLQQDIRLPESSVHDFGRDLLAALQYLHSHSIIHCDVKPSNVLLDENGTIKLGGFSVARKLADINETPIADLQQAQRGTPAYMAPELFQKGAAHSTASDFWAFGCVLYQCFAGSPPFVSPSFNELVRSILHDDYPPMDCATPEFCDLISRLLDKNPATRMTWSEMLTHQFWHFTLAQMNMPPEPALERYIREHQLAPNLQKDGWESKKEQQRAGAQARLIRESVDISRLSQIVRDNLCHRDEDAHGSAAPGDAGDINLANADAELVFSALDQGENCSRLSNDTSAPSTPKAHATNRPAEPPTPPMGTPVNGTRSALEPAAGAVAAISQEPTMSARTTVVQSVITHSTGVPLLGDLLFTDWDLRVMPLVGNKRIENLPEPQWSRERLPAGVPVLSFDDLKRSQSAATDLIDATVKTLLGCAAAPVKVNVLAYLESLCVQPGCADVLVNTRLSATLLHLFELATASVLKVRVASVLGLLVRHSTFIEISVVNPAIQALREGLQDGDREVRRRAMVALGEFIFYMANVQSKGRPHMSAARGGQDHCPPGPVNVAEPLVGDVGWLLQAGGDSIMQHYIAKAVENILTRDGFWPWQFCTESIVVGLLQLMKEGPTDAVRSASNALARILSLKPALVSNVVAADALQVARPLLPAEDWRLQVAVINLLNVLLLHTSPEDVSGEPFFSDTSVLSEALELLHTSAKALIRCKGLLLLSLLTRCNLFWLHSVCEPLLALASRLVEGVEPEVQEYAAACQACFYTAMVQLAPAVLEKITKSLVHVSAPAAHDGDGGGATELAGIVFQLLSSATYRPYVVTDNLLLEFSSLVSTMWKPVGERRELSRLAQEGSRAVLQALEAVFFPGDLLYENAAPLITHVLPTFCEVIHATFSQRSASELQREVASTLTRLLMDTLMFYVSPDTNISGSGLGSPAAAPDAQVANGQLAVGPLDGLLLGHVIPLLQLLMHEADPLPLYAQKILANVLPGRPEFLEQPVLQHLVKRFFEFLNIESPNNNIHNVRVCHVVVRTGAISGAELKQMDVPLKVSQVLNYAHVRNVQPFLEPTVNLCLAIVHRDINAVAAHAPEAGLSEPFIKNAVSFAWFACARDALNLDFALDASEILQCLSQMFPTELCSMLLSDLGIETAASALELPEQAEPDTPTDKWDRIVLNMLLTLLHCGRQGTASARPSGLQDLHVAVQRLQQVACEDVAAAADQVAAMFS